MRRRRSMAPPESARLGRAGRDFDPIFSITPIADRISRKKQPKTYTIAIKLKAQPQHDQHL